MAPALWGGAGFVLGAVFWHLVGFWSFVSEIVYKGPEGGASVAVVRKNDARSAASEASNGPSAEAFCIALVRDRVSGDTRSAGCTLADRVLPHLGAGVRSDLASLQTSLGTADGWTVTADQDAGR